MADHPRPSPNTPAPEGSSPEGAGPDAPAPSEYQEDEGQEPVDQLAALFREEPLPPEGAEAVPVWLWITIFGVVLFGAYYMGHYIGDFSPYPWLQQPELAVAEPASASAEVQVDGAQIYSSRCASCHQADGQGVSGAFPPLDGTRWVTGEKAEIIRILLHGMQGEVEVQGETYNGNMPAWGQQLSDQEIAAVITHERTSWSNSASEVTAEEVAAIRAATEGRQAQWTADELRDAPPLSEVAGPEVAAADSAASDSSAASDE